MKKNTVINYVFFFVFFIFLVHFFLYIHPLYIFDSDDWISMSIKRPLYPSLDAYNPIKVFPEVFMPIVSLIGVKLFYPINADYIFSIAIANALVISFIIVVYLYLVRRLFLLCLQAFSCIPTTRFNYNTTANLLVLVFFLFHFYLVKEGAYLFSTGNVTCIYHYTICALINIIAVLLLVLNDNSKKQLLCFNSCYKNISFLFLLYCCVFSNLFHSIILISYVLAKTLFSQFPLFNLKKLKSKKKDKDSLSLSLVRSNYQYLLLILVWGVSLIMEANGGRAEIGNSNHLSIDSLLISINNFAKTIVEFLNFKRLWFFALFPIVANILLFFKHSNARFNQNDVLFAKLQLLFLLITFIIMSFYVLLTIKTGIGYQKRVDITISYAAFIYLEIIASFIYLISNADKIIFILPLLIFSLSYSIIIKHPESYKDPNLSNIDANLVRQFGNQIVNNLVNASKSNLSSYELHVPSFNSNDNFPIANYAGNFISNALYRQGLIKKEMEVKLVIDNKLNKEYGF